LCGKIFWNVTNIVYFADLSQINRKWHIRRSLTWMDRINWTRIDWSSSPISFTTRKTERWTRLQVSNSCHCQKKRRMQLGRWRKRLNCRKRLKTIIPDDLFYFFFIIEVVLGRISVARSRMRDSSFPNSLEADAINWNPAFMIFFNAFFSAILSEQRKIDIKCNH